MQKIVCHQGGRCTHITESQQGNTKKITSTRMNAQHTDQQNTNEIQRGEKKKSSICQGWLVFIKLELSTNGFEKLRAW